MSKDEKLKLGLSFVYDAPPGFKGFKHYLSCWLPDNFLDLKKINMPDKTYLITLRYAYVCVRYSNCNGL